VASKPSDADGLKNIYMTLGQIDSALTSHIGEAVERKDGSDMPLKKASARLLEAQSLIGDTLRKMLGT
jgi:hypothetical protein